MAASKTSVLPSLLVVLLYTPSLILAKHHSTTLPDGETPLTDPQDDPNNPLRYLPNTTLTAIGVAFYLFTSSCMVLLLFLSRWRARYMLCVVIGGFAMVLGLALRFILAKHPDSNGVYIAEQLLVVLSPVGFIAGNYILLGRIARHLDSGQYLLIPARKITKVFVASDIITFLIQGSGGGLSTSDSVSTAEAGSHIFLAGLVLQMISYFFYTGVFLLFLYRVKTRSPEIWRRSKTQEADGSPVVEYKWWRDWRALAGALSLSCVGILIRSVYRTIELSQGYVGPLATNEHTFYGLDTLPLFIAITVYLPFWPGRFINSDRLDRMEKERKARGSEEVITRDVEADKGDRVEMQGLPGSSQEPVR